MKEQTLVFADREPGIIPWTLIGFILLSALVHLFGFYLFQTVYPPSAHISPPPAQVSYLAPGTPEADALLRWVDSMDSALVARPQKAAIPNLLTLPYVPSYATVHARPALVGPVAQPLPFPAGANGLDLVRMALPHSAAPAAQPENLPSTLVFSGELRDQSSGSAPALAGLRSSQPGALQPARFLLGVSDGGEVRYVFLQESSGDKALDAAASQVLNRSQFRRLSAPLTWGFATFSWGAAAYAQPSPAP